MAQITRSTAVAALAIVLIGLTACSGARRAAGGCCPQETACCSDKPPPPPSDRPAEAKDGEAWCQVWIPPVRKTVVETFCVCAERTEKVRVPAEYGVRPRLCCLSGPKIEEVIQPGVWTTKKRDVLCQPAREVWERTDCSHAPGPDGKPCCECYRKTVRPPVYQEVEEAVCLAEPKKCVKFTPAKYKLVDERYMISPARCETRVIPAKFDTRIRDVCVTPGKWVWRQNPDCVVPEPLLPALEVEMVDSDAAGNREGIFAVGETVRYDLIVRSDEGGEAFPNLKVAFSLPEQLEFISGGGDVVVTGSAQGAKSAVFPLPEEGDVKIFILARVVAVPPTAFVQAAASIQNESGEELTRETESTTLSAAAK